MISLAFLATVINYLDRQTLSVAAPVLREQFHMSNVDYSRVVFAFLLAYTIMNGVSGPLIDRLGTRLGYGLCIAWWSVAAVLHAFARGALSLGVFRFLLGMGEAGNWPGAVKVVAEWFPEQRARAGLAAYSIAGPRWARFWRRRSWPSSCCSFGWQSAFRVRGGRGLGLAGVLVRHLPHARGARPRRRERSAVAGLAAVPHALRLELSPSRRFSWTRSGTSTSSGSRNT